MDALVFTKHKPIFKLTNTIGVLPLEAHLQIVALVDNIKEPIQQLGALLLRHATDAFNISTNRGNILPAGSGVRFYKWMNYLKFVVDICAWR